MSGQPGVVTAVVATAPDDQGRVGLRYPWLPHGESLEPVYAPVAASLAGASRRLAHARGRGRSARGLPARLLE